MRPRYPLLTLIPLLCFAASDASELELQIVDFPELLLSHSPVLVTAEVRNVGVAPAKVATRPKSANQIRFEIAKQGEGFLEADHRDVTTIDPYVVEIDDGGSWIVLGDLRSRIRASGKYEVRAVLMGDGSCGRVEPSEPGECWTGRLVSQVAPITVVDPSSDVDTAALEYLLSDEFPLSFGSGEQGLDLRLWNGSKYLKTRHPQSHFTYVSVFYGSKEFGWLLETQPQNKLNKYAILYDALKSLRDCYSNAVRRKQAALELPATEAFALEGLPPQFEQLVGQERERLSREFDAVARQSKAPSGGKTDG